MNHIKNNFSIVICNYNYENFIVEALQSALSQTVSPLEVIVVDDGSTDNSLLNIKIFTDHPLVKIISKANEGQISAYNLGFKVARGEYIIFLDSDDLLAPTLIERLVPVFMQQNIVKVHWKLRLINSDSLQFNRVIPSVLSHGDLKTMLLKSGVLYNSAPGSGNAYSRNALKYIFPLPSDKFDKHGADFFAIYGISLFGNIASINDVLGSYRLHTKNLNAKSELAFGNAVKFTEEPTRTNLRAVRFQNWIRERYDLTFLYPQFTDFSLLKSEYGLSLMAASWGMTRLRVARKIFPRLIRGIYSRVDLSHFTKLLLVAWSLVIVVLPSVLAKKITSWITNPIARPDFFL